MTQQPDFAQLLSQHIADSTLSLRRVSVKAGVPKTTIVNWQSGTARRPQLWRDVARVAAALEVDEATASALLVAAGHPPIAALRLMALVREDQAALRRWTEGGPEREPEREPESGPGEREVGDSGDGAHLVALQGGEQAGQQRGQLAMFRFQWSFILRDGLILGVILGVILGRIWARLVGR